MTDSAQLVALIAATGLIAVAMAAVVWRDLAGAHLPVGRVRSIVEALVPAVGVAILLGAVWRWVS
ncbi:MAG: hypothetical protein BMS9Abin07_2144 [Acidimicrobiia bacterium]|nr:MAG: hypothetical protein BMS9Abin07_2144 [Acidimicrobiia bacterium]